MMHNKKMLLSLFILTGAGYVSNMLALTVRQKQVLEQRIKAALVDKKVGEAERLIGELEAAGAAYKKDVEAYKGKLEVVRAAQVQQPVQPGQLPPPPPAPVGQQGPPRFGQPGFPPPPVQPGQQQPQQQGAPVPPPPLPLAPVRQQAEAQDFLAELVQKADEIRRRTTFAMPGRIGKAPEMAKTAREKMHEELLEKQQKFAQRAEVKRVQAQEAQEQDPFSAQPLKEMLESLVNGAGQYTKANIEIATNINQGQLLTETMINNFLENTYQITLGLSAAEQLIQGKQLGQKETDLFNMLQFQARDAAEYSNQLLEYAYNIAIKETQQEAQQIAADEEWKKNKDRWYNLFKTELQEFGDAFDFDPQSSLQVFEGIKNDTKASDGELALSIINFFVTKAEDSSYSSDARKAFIAKAKEWLESPSLTSAIAKDTRAGWQGLYQDHVKDLEKRLETTDNELHSVIINIE